MAINLAGGEEKPIDVDILLDEMDAPRPFTVVVTVEDGGTYLALVEEASSPEDARAKLEASQVFNPTFDSVVAVFDGEPAYFSNHSEHPMEVVEAAK